MAKLSLPAATKTVTLPRPLPHQVGIILDPSRFKVVACGRRWGKSILGQHACVAGHGPARKFKGALEGASIRWIAPTYVIASMIWKSLKRALWAAWTHKDEVGHTITLPGGGAIKVCSGDNPDSLRGPGSDGVVLDEAAFMNPEVWESAVRPSLADKQGWAIFISSPNGFNWFHDLYQKATREGWARWQRPTADNPIVPAAEIEDARQNTVEYRFRQEWLAEFTAPGIGFFKRENWQFCEELPTPIVRAVRAWDFASTRQKEGVDPDWTRGICVAEDLERRVYLFDGVGMQGNPDDKERLVIATAQADGYGRPIWIPEDPGSAGVDVASYWTRRLAGWRIHAHKETGDKAHRAEPLAVQQQRQRVYIVAPKDVPWNHWSRSFLAEADIFPTEKSGQHDDWIDAASLGYRMLTASGGGVAKVEPSRTVENALQGLAPTPQRRDGEKDFYKSGNSEDFFR